MPFELFLTTQIIKIMKENFPMFSRFPRLTISTESLRKKKDGHSKVPSLLNLNLLGCGPTRARTADHLIMSQVL